MFLGTIGPMSTARVVRYYDTFNEWARLDTPAGILELERTLAIVMPHLGAGSRILDLGGGPGRYTIELAQAGHRVCLADLSPRLLEIARQKIAEHGVAEQVESVTCVNATDLGAYTSGSFDAVLALGPFYHLTSAADRQSAASEVCRVLKPGALAAIAFMPRLTGIAGLIARAANIPEQVPPAALAEAWSDGVFHNGTSGGFQEGYFAQPEDIRTLFASLGVCPVGIYSIRGVAAGQEQALLHIRETSPELHRQFIQILADTARREEVIALGGHALYLGRRS